jgi:hypothetical protein
MTLYVVNYNKNGCRKVTRKTDNCNQFVKNIYSSLTLWRTTTSALDKMAFPLAEKGILEPFKIWFII